MERQIREFYDVHPGGSSCRREFLKRLAGVIGGAAAVGALLPQRGADAQIVAQDDPRLHT